MSDEPKPEADALEQAQPLVDDEDDVGATDDPEVSEADLLDQRRAVAPSSDNAVRTSPDPEVPDADAAEQRRAVIDDEEACPD